MKTILITGINGFLGSSLAKALKKEYNIIGLEYSLDNLYRLTNESFKVYSVENGIPDEIFKEQHIDIIIHTATFYGKNEDITQMAHANLFLPFQLLNKAIKFGFGLFINTDTVLVRITNIYSLTKRQFREWLFLRQNEIKVINMQLEHFYGPGAPDTNFITAMIKRLKQNEPVINLTAGEQERDFVFIEDVVSAYNIIIENKDLLKENYNNFQICSGEIISISSLMLYLKKITQSKTNLNFGIIPYREQELMKSISNNKQLLELGWKPNSSFLKNLKKII